MELVIPEALGGSRDKGMVFKMPVCLNFHILQIQKFLRSKMDCNFFFLFRLPLWHMEVPRPGNQPSQSRDLFHSWDSSGSFNPLLVGVSTKTSQIVNPLCHSRNSQMDFNLKNILTQKILVLKGILEAISSKALILREETEAQRLSWDKDSVLQAFSPDIWEKIKLF